jgi:membrane protein CcdC involved in cytochrome C biogenesis
METENNNIRYNYYSIECLNIRRNENGVMATYEGKINEPNIIYNDDENMVINYQAKELFIYGKIHSISDINQDGEIVIIHRSTTSGEKLYCCFPFVYKDNCIETEIDTILLSKESSTSNVYNDKSIVLEMNKLIKTLPKIQNYEAINEYGERCRVFVFNTLVEISQKVNINQTRKIFENVNYKFDIMNKSFQNKIVLEDKLRTPLFLNKEGFEGKDDEVIYSCEYLPVDSEDMVQVLQVPIGSPGYSNLVGNEVSTLFLNNGILMFIVILLFCLAPLFHSFIVTKIKEMYKANNSEEYMLIDIVFIKDTIEQKVNPFNLILISIVVLLTIILLIIGSKTNNSTASSIAIFLPFCGYVGYLGIIYFQYLRKNKSPTDDKIQILNAL